MSEAALCYCLCVCVCVCESDTDRGRAGARALATTTTTIGCNRDGASGLNCIIANKCKKLQLGDVIVRHGKN